MPDNQLPTHTVPAPTAAAVSGTKRVIERIGGRVHAAPHSDRVSVVTRDGKDEREELCTCNQVAIADVPQPGLKPAARVCIVCDSLPRWPRVLREAGSMAA